MRVWTFPGSACVPQAATGVPPVVRWRRRDADASTRDACAPRKGFSPAWPGLVFLVLLFSAARSARAAAPALPAEPGWRLVWSDEFNGPALDPSKWTREVSANGGGNHELQYYTARPENSFVRGGCLVIEARRERHAGPEGVRDYASAKLTTAGKAAWKYGRIEVRARLPRGRGLWPAFWLLPAGPAYGPWPHSGEIDLMESIGQQPDKVLGTLHYTTPDGRHTYTGQNYFLPAGTFADGFHVFALEWDAREICWFVDGVCYETQTRWQTDAAPYPAPFDRKFYLILNLAVGGDMPGSPDAATVFPQRLIIDYVRVYQRNPPPADARR